MSGTAHVIGAGLAGLAAAVRLAEGGWRVRLSEAAPHAGGRCRSYYDPTFGAVIDNGNHLLLSGNTSALDYVRRVGADGMLVGPDEAAFPFVDLASGERWTLRPNDGRAPWWVLSPSRRVPGARAWEYLRALGILRAGPDSTIGSAMRCEGALYDRLWRPVLLAGLNTEPPDASAALAAAMIRETLAAGGTACRPLVAAHGLSHAFVDPGLAFLRARGADIRFGKRLRALGSDAAEVHTLDFGEEREPVAAEDVVVLAAPAVVARDLMPGLETPVEYRAIVNAHFQVEPPPGAPLFIGVVNATTEWIFSFPGRLSVTISGADRLLDTPREELAALIWGEVAAVMGVDAPLPRWQIVRERRATFAALPSQAKLRPPAHTRWRNLALAGDWTATGLPATIEGAIRSGDAAAALFGRADARVPAEERVDVAAA